MSTTGEMSINGPLWSAQPWVWIVIPIGLVAVLGVAGFTLHMCRRRQHRRRTVQVLADPVANRALERDVLEMWERGAGTSSANGGQAGSRTSGRMLQPRSPIGRAGWSARPFNRWAWAGSSNAVRAAEEGLNELGEAPPPYPGIEAVHSNKPEDDEGLVITTGAVSSPLLTTIPVTGGISEPQPSHTRITVIADPPPSPPLYSANGTFVDESAIAGESGGPRIAQPVTAMLPGQGLPPPFNGWI